MLIIRNKFSLLIVISSAFIALYCLFMIWQSNNFWEQQKEISTQNIQVVLAHNYEAQSNAQRRAITALSALPDLQPHLYSRGTEIHDSLKRCIKLSGIDFIILTDQYFIPLTSYPRQSEDVIKLLPATRDIFKRKSTESKEVIYYGWIGNTLYKITGLETTRIDSLGNIMHNTYQFFGHHFDQQQLSELAAPVAGEVSLVKEPTAKAPVSSINETNNQIPLYGNLTYPVASLQLKTKAAIMNSDLIHNRWLLLWGIVGMVMVMTGMLIYMRRNYLLPMKELKLVLLHKNPDLFHTRLTGDKDYEAIKNQLLNLFSQQHLLSELIKRQPSVKTLDLHSAILDQINEVVYVTNCDDKIVFWNQAAEKYYNIPQQEAIQQIASTLIPIIWKNADESNKVEKTLNEQGFIEDHFKQSLPTGETRRALLNIRRIFDCTNKPTGNIYILNG